MKLVEEPEDDLDTLAALRGISHKVLDDAGIRTQIGGSYDGWYALPYPHRSGIWKTRYYQPDTGHGREYRDDPGAAFHLYNPLKLGSGEEEVWFAEGEFDTLALIDQGLNAIGIHGVGNVKKSKAEEDKDSDETEEEVGFRRTWQLLFADTLCIVMFDNDDKGRPAGRRLARGLEGEVFDGWVDNFKDANEWHRSDPAGLGAAIDRFRRGVYRSRGLVSGEPLVE